MTTYRFTFDTDLEVGGEELELRVTYSVTSGCPARLYGDYPHPEEYPEVEIISVKHNGAHITLSNAEDEALLEMARERAADDVAGEIAEAEEWRAQSRRDRMMEGF